MHTYIIGCWRFLHAKTNVESRNICGLWKIALLQLMSLVQGAQSPATELITKLKLCYNCLLTISEAPFSSKGWCSSCGQPHHTSLLQMPVFQKQQSASMPRHPPRAPKRVILLETALISITAGPAMEGATKLWRTVMELNNKCKAPADSTRVEWTIGHSSCRSWPYRIKAEQWPQLTYTSWPKSWYGKTYWSCHRSWHLLVTPDR